MIFSLREKFVCFYMFLCYEVGLFFLREVLLYLWHQRSDSVFSLRGKSVVIYVFSPQCYELNSRVVLQ